jgi:predicted lipoprotein
MRRAQLALGVAMVLLTVSCTDNSGPVDSNFDRTGMLTAIADKIIIPSYNSASAAAAVLTTKCQGALADQTLDVTELSELRDAARVLMRRTQQIASFNFGPAEGDFGTLMQEIGTFPCDTSGVESRIGSADTLLTDFRRDTRGLAALDYLLWGSQSDEQITALFSGAQAASRRAYLQAVMIRLLAELESVRTQWQLTYRSIFISRSGTDAGSSVSLLFNELNKSFELLKNFKLGLPLGLRAGQTTTEPTKIEAYYSGLSYELLGLHFSSIEEIWSGRLSDGTVIPSFRDYLLAVVNGPRLVEDTEAQMVRIDAAYGTVSQSQMDVLIRTNPQALVALHTEMQKLTRFIKSEMSSLLGISITYSSGDGD